MIIKMKNLKYLLMGLVSMVLMVSCDYEKAIPESELPTSAQTFIKKTYPMNTIVVTKKDVEWFTTKYKVNLDNGMEIEFDSDGLPLDVDVD